MATQIKNYIFDASAKTISFPDYISVDKNSVALIVNIDDNAKTIAQFNKNGYGILSVTNNVITLEYDTTLMSDSDELVIYYNDKDLPDQLPFKNAAQNVFLKDKQYFYSLSTDIGSSAWTFDLSGFAGFTISFKGGGGRTIDIEGSNDLITWGYLKFASTNPTNFQNKDAGFIIPTMTSGVETDLYFAKTTKYLRLTNTSSVTFGAIVVTLHHTAISKIGSDENDTYLWSYIPLTTGGITSASGTAGVVDMNIAPGATSRWAITSIDLKCSTGTGTEVRIKNKTSGVVLWLGFVSATLPISNVLSKPLYGDLNNILTIEVLTASNTVYPTIQGKKMFN